MSSTFIVDNGSYTIKAGFQNDEKPKIIPNFIFKSSTDTFIGNKIDKANDPAGVYLNSPFERGYLVHMDTQDEIWQQVFGKQEFGVNFSDTKLVLTDSNMTVPAIETGHREVLFETYGVHSLQLASAPSLVAQYHFSKTNKPYSLVIDSGHSFTHLLPCIDGKIVIDRSMRIDVGGRIMTNFLRNKLSYSQIDLRSETRVVNEIKEDVCYFAKNFRQEMSKFKVNPKRIEYYLPDYTHLRRGQIKTTKDSDAFKSLSSVHLGVERFVLPETIFCPSLLKIDQMGLKDAINKTCNGAMDYVFFGKYMLQNIIVFGGNASIPGFKDRLSCDLANAFDCDDTPSNIADCIHISPNPITEPWNSAKYLLENVAEFSNKFVTKKEYQEHGIRICDEKFIDYAPKEWYEGAEDAPYVDENGRPIDDIIDHKKFIAALPKPSLPTKATATNKIISELEHSSLVNNAVNAHLVQQVTTENPAFIDAQTNALSFPDVVAPPLRPDISTAENEPDIIEIDYIPPPPAPTTTAERLLPLRPQPSPLLRHRMLHDPSSPLPPPPSSSLPIRYVQRATILRQQPIGPIRGGVTRDSHYLNTGSSVPLTTTNTTTTTRQFYITSDPNLVRMGGGNRQVLQLQRGTTTSRVYLQRRPITSATVTGVAGVEVRPPQPSPPGMPKLQPEVRLINPRRPQQPIRASHGQLYHPIIHSGNIAASSGQTPIIRVLQPVQRMVIPPPQQQHQPYQGLEEEYESGESDPPTPL